MRNACVSESVSLARLAGPAPGGLSHYTRSQHRKSSGLFGYYWCSAPSPATCARGDAAVFTDAHVSLTSRLRARDPQGHSQGHSPAAGDRCGFVVFDTVDLR